MAWEDRPYYRDRGASSNPLVSILSGSVPTLTIFGIRVRVHISLIIFVAGELLFDRRMTLGNRLASMGILSAVLLLHEFGHCLAARMVGGSSDEIILWPLGGWTFPDTPHRPSARFITSLGGLAVNVILCALTAWGVHVFKHASLPLDVSHPDVPMAREWHSAGFWCWWGFFVSYILLIFNVLPIYPLDGGRVVQSFFWKITEYHRSMVVSTYIGMAGALALLVFGLWRLDFSMIMLAGFLFYACYQEQLILREAEANEPWQIDQPDFAASLQNATPRRRRVSARARNRARKRARADAAERQRLDDILAKVSAQGLGSLTWREKRILHKETEQRRKRDLELKSLIEE